jgi:hypothetical protein
MVIDFIINSVMVVFNTVMTTLPDLPDVPISFSTIADQAIYFVTSTSSFIFDVFGKTFVMAILGLGIALLLFENVYHLIMWVIKKLPFSIQ